MAEIVDCLVGLTREEMYVAIRDTWHATVKETLIYAGDGAVLSNQMIQKFADAVAGRSKRELEAALRLILGSVEVVINAKLNAAIDRLSDSTKAWPIRMGDLCPSFRTSSKNSGDFAASRPRTNVCLQGYPTGTDAPSIGKFQ